MMNRDPKRMLVAALLSTSALAPASLQAQAIDCAAGDGFCLQRMSEAACRERDASRSACESWLRRLEDDPERDAIERQLARGWVYMFLADFATVSSLPDFGSVSAAEANAFRAQAASIFRDAAAEAPDDVEALGSLVAISDSSAERIRLLRRIVSEDPAAFTSVEFLVSELLLQSDAPATYLEAGELFASTYERVDFVPKRWDLASRALDFYERSGDTTRRDAFRQQWAGDLRIGSAVAEFNADATLPQRKNMLAALCDSHVTAVFGNATCLQLIDSAVALLPALAASNDKLQFAEHLVSLMAMVADTTPADGQALKETYRAHVEALIAQGLESTTTLNHYATLLPPDAQIPILERAVELTPENGDVRYRLALVQMEQGQWAEAAEHLRIARNGIAEWKLPYLEQQLQRAENQISLQPQ